jgi:hypothetical protein
MSTVTAWAPGIVLQAIDLSPAIVGAIQEALSPAQTVALTAWAEARSRLVPRKGWVSNPLDAMVDIITVIDNRAKDPRWQALGHKGVCLQRRQFSCWDALGGPENFHALLARAQQLLADQMPSDKLLGCLAAAEGCFAGALVDTLSGATHYIADWLQPWPLWAKGKYPVANRHGHLYFSGVA